MDGLLSLGPYEPSSKVSDVLEWLRDEAYEELSPPSSNAHHMLHDIDHSHHHDLNRHDDEIRATCITLEEPVSGKAVDAWLEALLRWRGEDLLRVKGIIHVAELDAPMIIHGVQHIFHPPFVLPGNERRPQNADRLYRAKYRRRDLKRDARSISECGRAPRHAFR